MKILYSIPNKIATESRPVLGHFHLFYRLLTLPTSTDIKTTTAQFLYTKCWRYLSYNVLNLYFIYFILFLIYMQNRTKLITFPTLKTIEKGKLELAIAGVIICDSLNSCNLIWNGVYIKVLFYNY